MRLKDDIKSHRYTLFLFVDMVLFHISEEHGLLSHLLIKKEIYLPSELISEIINRILSLRKFTSNKIVMAI